MTELLCEWVNGLDLDCLGGAQIDTGNLDEAFASGFALGDLLHRFNQLHTLDRFSLGMSADAKIQNFSLLEPVLRALNVRFDAPIAFSVMQASGGATTTILYQLQMVLSKLAHFATPVSTHAEKAGGVKPLPNMPARPSKPAYDRASQAMFEAAIRRMVENQNDVLMAAHLRRFEDEAVRQADGVRAEKERTIIELERCKDEVRAQRLYQRTSERVFMESWEAKGLEQWEANQARATARLELRERVQLNREHKIVKAHENQREAATREVVDSIAQFEARQRATAQYPSNSALALQGRDDPGFGDDGALEGGKLRRARMDAGMQAQLSTVRARKAETAKHASARERRRRQYIAESEAAQATEYHSRAASQLEAMLTRPCVAEVDLDAKLNMIAEHREMMVANRAHREAMYAKREETDREEALQRDDAHLKEALKDYQDELVSQEERYAASLEARASAQRRRNELLCREVLGEAVDLAVEVAAFRTFAKLREGTGTPIPELQWTDLKRSFVRGTPLLALDGCAADERPEWGASSTLRVVGAAEDGDRAAALATDLDAADYADYVAGEAPWALADDVEVAEGGEAAATAVGDALMRARVLAEPLANAAAPPAVPQFDLRVCLCGRSFAGKSEQAVKLAERYGLKVLSAEAALRDAVQLAKDVQFGRKRMPKGDSAEAQAARRVAALGKDAAARLHSGQEALDATYAALLVEAVRKVERENGQRAILAADLGDDADEADVEPYMGWVVEDFPETAAQAALLERCLTGYDADHVVPTQWDRASALCASTPKPPTVPGTLLSAAPEAAERVPSGVDLVVYLDVGRGPALKRSLGRRTDPETDAAYHLDTNRPAYDVVCKERLLPPTDPSNPPGSLSLQVAAHDTAAPALHAYLERFGTLRVVQGDGKTVQGLFASVNGLVTELLKAQGKAAKATAAEAAAAKAAAEDAAAKDEAQAALMATAAKAAKAQAAEELAAVLESGDKKAIAAAEAAAAESAAAELAAAEAADRAAAAAEAAAEAPLAGRLGDPGLTLELGAVMAKQWGVLEDHFVGTSKRCFRALREERLQAVQHLHDTRVAFEAYLARPTEAQVPWDAFVADLNGSIDSDMRYDDATKAELHLRTAELQAELWTLTEGREAAAQARLAALRADGYVPCRGAAVAGNCVTLMQLELHRFAAGARLVADTEAAEGAAAAAAAADAAAAAAAAAADGAADAAAEPGLASLVAYTPPPPSDEEAAAAAAAAAAAPAAAKGKAAGKKEAKGKKGGAADAEAAPATVSPTPPDLSAPPVPTEEELAAAAAAAKGKAKGKGKAAAEAPEEDEAPPPDPVAQALSTARAYLAAAVAAAAAAAAAPAGGGAAAAAVAHEAGLCEARLAGLVRFADELRAGIAGYAASVYDELEAKIAERIATELSVVERAVGIAGEGIEAEVALHTDVRFVNGVVFGVEADPASRVTPVPAPPPVPFLEARGPNALAPTQRAALVAAVESAARAERVDGAAEAPECLTVGALKATVARLALAQALPDGWAGLAEDAWGGIVAAASPGGDVVGTEEAVHALEAHFVLIEKSDRGAFADY